MVGDYQKFNASLEHANPAALWDNTLPRGRYKLLKKLFLHLAAKHRRPPVKANVNNKPSPGRWYDAGTGRTATMLSETGYRVLDSDVGSCLRDPILHFQKP
jgi:hypothetical protein